ncbi:MAG: transcriptional regulator [Saprospiraceae bacterium]|nr:transcriptional regulator [Saprospiraceae bacterium]
MNYTQGRARFIESWGKLAIDWGANRTMGQVHALLLISPEPICADEVMEHLQISRGNANTTLRRLIDWGIVYKHFKPGERKEFFTAEKDMWKVMKSIIQVRKKKELDPMIKVIDELSEVQPLCSLSEEFCSTVKEIKVFSDKADKVLDNITQSEMNWLMNSMLRFMR